MSLLDRFQNMKFIRAEAEKIFSAFLKAVTEKNEEFIKVLISEEGILQRHFSENGDTLLHIIAQRGTVTTAAEMCKLGSDVNSQNNFSETPIFHAIKNSPEMVNLLINNGGSLTKKCDKYVKPLQAALLFGTETTVQIIMNKIFADKPQSHLRSIKVQTSEETIRALLNHREDFSLEGFDYPLLIYFATKIGGLELLKIALDGCREYLDSRDQEMLGKILPPKELNFDSFVGRTALHYAVWQQDLEAVRLLLKEGADVNCKTLEDYTPMHFAAHFKNEEMCNILVSFGAEVRGYCKGLTSVNPLYLVCGSYTFPHLFEATSRIFYGRTISTRIFRSWVSKPKPTFNLGMMKLLLQYGFDPDFGDEDSGMTPLLEACKAGCLEPVKLLLEFKADIRICDYKGNSTLHCAAHGGNFKIVDLLLERGLDIDIKNRDGLSPLLSCLCHREEHHVEMIEYLADFGANINATNSTGKTAFEIALQFQSPDNFECLLELGVKIDSELISINFHFLLYQNLKTLIAFCILKENILEDLIRTGIENQRNDMSEINQFCKMCKNEMKQLKCTKILENRKFLFYDFLGRDIYRALRIIENKKVREVFTMEEYKNQFPCYAYLLKKRFERLERLETTVAVDDVVQFLCDNKNFSLPILIVDNILSFLSSSDIRNFGRALSSKRN